MAVKRCVDCGKADKGVARQMKVSWKECPYCERALCSNCAYTQQQVFNWNGCKKWNVDYQFLNAN
ncbi:hypothetical protein BKP35_01120 [Anaerobacillus arseniciselenatis]|uniref:Uncharacterized protein n=1 Tax=Anaerobacillus arseniciselenatis TaxID=85682 RepID=A0A1S2LTG7_9BACI|nr:hypothetical protein [Anaerobacillus arseniciselenatis]OIJ15624.1 hypothetical protein BKP35_01120 [Anaerobacillus arseniciselenatis]